MQTTTSTSPTPRHAPAHFRTLPRRVVTSDGDGLWLTWHGCGEPTDTPCAGCGNVAGNLRIYLNWGHSYPNGHSWRDEELVCFACDLFTTHNQFREG